MLKIKLFADGANLADIKNISTNPKISGFTTNPTLMRKAGVKNYKHFALEMIRIVHDKPISFEVFADDFLTMESQAMEIASWGDNVNVKIPVTNTQGLFSGELINRLSSRGVKLNVTAVMTLGQTIKILDNLSDDIPSIISIFAGRIADTGIDPLPIMVDALKLLTKKPKAELIWASPREVLNIFQADSIGCHIITATNDILQKLDLMGKDLTEFSLETVSMFYRDAQAAGYSIDV